MQDYLDAKHPSFCVDSDDETEMTVVALMGILLKRPTVTIIGPKKNLILLKHSNVTSTDLNG
jgi:hypothetical protein